MLLHVKSERNILEWVFLHGGVIFFQIVIQGLFVTDMPVKLHVVMNPASVWATHLFQVGYCEFNLVLALAE